MITVPSNVPRLSRVLVAGDKIIGPRFPRCFKDGIVVGIAADSGDLSGDLDEERLNEQFIQLALKFCRIA